MAANIINDVIILNKLFKGKTIVLTPTVSKGKKPIIQALSPLYRLVYQSKNAFA